MTFGIFSRPFIHNVSVIGRLYCSFHTPKILIISILFFTKKFTSTYTVLGPIDTLKYYFFFFYSLYGAFNTLSSVYYFFLLYLFALWRFIYPDNPILNSLSFPNPHILFVYIYSLSFFLFRSCLCGMSFLI